MMKWQTKSHGKESWFVDTENISTMVELRMMIQEVQTFHDFCRNNYITSQSSVEDKEHLLRSQKPFLHLKSSNTFAKRETL